MNKRFKQIALLAILGFFLGTASAWLQASREMKAGSNLAQIEPAAGSSLAGATIGGPFSLVDHNGQPVTDADYAQSYKLVYFGFTYCPEVCPTELQKMAVALHQMGDIADMVQPIFITTDPARDTPNVMKAYVKMFHPKLVGLTGTKEQIQSAQHAYKVYATRIEDPALSDYTMEHSSYMFLMSPENQPLALFTTQDTPADIADQVKKIIGNS